MSSFSLSKIFKKPLHLVLWKFLKSTKLTVLCLCAIMLLTFWGTLYQTEFGLYQSQQRFFYSWIVWISYVPFPGGLLCMWLLTINLLLNVIFVFKWSWRKSGILIMHYGLLILLIGSGVTFYFSDESSLTLSEGSSSNVAWSFQDWEISIWQTPENTLLAKSNDASTQESKDPSLQGKLITSIDFGQLSQGTPVDLMELHGVHFQVTQHFPNAIVFGAETGLHKNLGVVNGSGIVQIQEKDIHPEVEQNFPAIEIQWNYPAKDLGPNQDSVGVVKKNVLLYGAENLGTIVPCAGGECKIQLRRKRRILPFKIKLVDFMKKNHTNTAMAKSYESLVEVTEIIADKSSKRNVKIWMNNPFRSQDITLFQSSFTQGEEGETSTFQVVYNPGRLVPYISSIITGLGLMIHFLSVSYRRRKKHV